MGGRIVFVNTRVDVLHLCYTDTLASLVTGKISTDFSANLMVKEPSIGAWASSTDPVTFDGQVLVGGLGGQYGYHFTATKEGQYELHVKNLAAGTTGLISRYEFTVMPQGAALVGSYTDAFCAQSDIEGQTGYEIGVASNPTDVEVADFAVLRARMLQGHLLAKGITVTPDGGSAPVDISSVSGTVLRDLLRVANAVGAGIDQIRHANRGVKPEKSQAKITEMYEYWESLLEQITDSARLMYGVTLIATPYTTGQVEEPDRTEVPEGSHIRITMTGDEL